MLNFAKSNANSSLVAPTKVVSYKSGYPEERKIRMNDKEYRHCICT
ncbi:hypothetical protein [Flavobacterium aestivum]|nr:hypothetical protein [Flavobacterium aestivum]